jgi:tricorn protease
MIPALLSILFRFPTISPHQIAFQYGSAIWTVGLHGGDARFLVDGYDPHFSPDGSMIAYTAHPDGNDDVYVIPAAGGQARRLTYHGGDFAVGWTPDGRRVLFRSNRASYSDPDQLYTIALHGSAQPSELPLPMAERGSYSPDGTQIAYVPNFQWEPFWKGYRGGQTTPVWIANLADSSVVKIPRYNNSNDNDPMWVDDTVYFLSDRDGPVTLFAYDTHTRSVKRLLPAKGFDITGASSDGSAIVYAKFDSLHVYDIATHRSRTISVSIHADLPQTHAHWQNVQDQIVNAGISPSGVRAVFEAHGQIFTVPTRYGDIRNITDLPGTANRDPAWSPNGRWIAYFSDASGEYKLCLKDQKGLQPPRCIGLGSPPSFFYHPVWSPDSTKIAYNDVRLNLWYVDVSAGRPVLVDRMPYEGFSPPEFDESWSPDGKWLAYDKLLPNHLHAIFTYSLAGGRTRQITDGMSDSRYPVFDRSGKYIYFTASTNTGLTADELDMTSDEYPVSSAVYVAVLQSNVASPIATRSDEEPAPSNPVPSPHPSPPRRAAKTSAASVTIDFSGIQQRILALPIPEANYVGLAAGGAGELYLIRAPLTTITPMPPPLDVLKFDMESRKATPLLEGISDFALSFDAQKMLYRRGKSWFVVSAKAPPKTGEGALDLASMELNVHPRMDWRQMYHETWRIERDFFYDPHYHGLNLPAAEQRFAPYVANIASRDDLTFLFREMLSYLSVGHMFVRAGYEPQVQKVNVGLLGADYSVDHDRYRFARVYDGENWNPQLRAPLTQPGARVRAGEYLLAVNGRSITATQSLYRFFQETAGKQVVLTVGPDPSGAGSRDVTVVPLADDHALRNFAWIEHNRRLVDQLSGGKLGYVYLPDTQFGGFTDFNRYYFSQIDKSGVIVDERFNHGGQVADYIIDYLSRKPMGILVPRYGRTSLDPLMAIYGPKVMIINQFSGSGGDALPWLFRKAHLGPLVGVRTWGGLVGIGGYPQLIDGGSVTAPRIAIGGLHGHWEVENHGIPPDIDVWQDPKLVREGHDPQLEAAVREAMELLRRHPLPHYQPPPYPNHHPVLPPYPR